jgi:hypothetical protein
MLFKIISLSQDAADLRGAAVLYDPFLCHKNKPPSKNLAYVWLKGQCHQYVCKIGRETYRIGWV